MFNEINALRIYETIDRIDTISSKELSERRTQNWAIESIDPHNLPC